MTLTKLRLNANEKGFTLIELMIVIAIIGILAAIAIPNFIAYRNKSFCSRAESDANNIASAVADYFAIPTNISITKERTSYQPPENTWEFGVNNPNTNIRIDVKDASGRCPEDYRDANAAAGTRDGWNDLTYQKNIATR
ncbi:prepilin-type N-terminal cleavage/methylation domain-containing protein [Desulfobulbus oligotrophicus]|uniref:prepilin-type N-terminal cleavage/methylation domain-containing protein n=1 Tax=Desulfobulbus oligotrophicus TaxID=1909699 RepID=UPI002FCE4F98